MMFPPYPPRIIFPWEDKAAKLKAWAEEDARFHWDLAFAYFFAIVSVVVILMTLGWIMWNFPWDKAILLLMRPT